MDIYHIFLGCGLLRYLIFLATHTLVSHYSCAYLKSALTQTSLPNYVPIFHHYIINFNFYLALLDIFPLYIPFYRPIPSYDVLRLLIFELPRLLARMLVIIIQIIIHITIPLDQISFIVQSSPLLVDLLYVIPITVISFFPFPF